MIDQPIERVAYGLAEAAEALGVGVTAFREIVGRGEVRTFRIGRRRLIRKRDLADYADRLFEAQKGRGAS